MCAVCQFSKQVYLILSYPFVLFLNLSLFPLLLCSALPCTVLLSLSISFALHCTQQISPVLLQLSLSPLRLISFKKEVNCVAVSCFLSIYTALSLLLLLLFPSLHFTFSLLSLPLHSMPTRSKIYSSITTSVLITVAEKQYNRNILLQAVGRRDHRP